MIDNCGNEKGKKDLKKMGREKGPELKKNGQENWRAGQREREEKLGEIQLGITHTVQQKHFGGFLVIQRQFGELRHVPNMDPYGPRLFHSPILGGKSFRVTLICCVGVNIWTHKGI